MRTARGREGRSRGAEESRCRLRNERRRGGEMRNKGGRREKKVKKRSAKGGRLRLAKSADRRYPKYGFPPRKSRRFASTASTTPSATRSREKIGAKRIPPGARAQNPRDGAVSPVKDVPPTAPVRVRRRFPFVMAKTMPKRMSSARERIERSERSERDGPEASPSSSTSSTPPCERKDSSDAAMDVDSIDCCPSSIDLQRKTGVEGGEEGAEGRDLRR